MEQELAYSFHLGSDKNKSKLAKKVAKELIRTIYGTDDIVNDVKQMYIDEFEEARLEYNSNQPREDRKIDNYFKKVCESQNDIACKIIIEHSQILNENIAIIKDYIEDVSFIEK